MKTRKRRSFWFEALFIFTAVLVGAAFSLKPWKTYLEQKELQQQSVREMKKAEGEMERLMQQKAEAESAIGREKLAREQGFLKPGERPIETLK
jgi:hypothetical protein